MVLFAKPLYALKRVPGVRIPPSPPDPYHVFFASSLSTEIFGVPLQNRSAFFC